MRLLLLKLLKKTMILKFPWTQFSPFTISQGNAVLFPLGGMHDAFPFSFFTYFYSFTLSYLNVLIFVVSPLFPCFVRLLSDWLPLKLLVDSHVFLWGPLRVIRVACMRMDGAVVCWRVGNLLVATPRKKVTPSSQQWFIAFIADGPSRKSGASSTPPSSMTRCWQAQSCSGLVQITMAAWV